MSLLETAIGWLTPAECINCGAEGSALCKNCGDSVIKEYGERCWRCSSLSPGGRTCLRCRHTGAPGFVWISTDHQDTARDLLSLYKFGHHRAAAEPIVRLMAGTFAKFDKGKPAGKNYLIVPIPTATSRVRERGFGHTELLARNIAARLRLERCNALRRLGQSRQLGAKREDRLRQLGSSFAVKNPGRIKGREILLIDDVVTTGGTLIAAAKTLRAAGAARVDALLFAKRL